MTLVIANNTDECRCIVRKSIWLRLALMKRKARTKPGRWRLHRATRMCNCRRPTLGRITPTNARMSKPALCIRFNKSKLLVTSLRRTAHVA